MEAKIEMITPKDAELYLSRNVNNYRKMDNRRVNLFARDIKNNEWELNGEAIKFNKDGELIDGQHRLAAIIKAGTSVRMLVVRGVSNNVNLFDMGKNRTPREYLIANGIQNSLSENVFIGAAVVMLNGSPTASSHGKNNVTKKELLNEIEENISTWEAVARCAGTAKKNGLATIRKACVYSAIYTLLKLGEDEETITDFIDVVKSGFPNERYESTPAIVLRNMLLVFSSTKQNDLYFSATMDAYYDFKFGVKRKRAYKVNEENLWKLKKVSEYERR